MALDDSAARQDSLPWCFWARTLGEALFVNEEQFQALLVPLKLSDGKQDTFNSVFVEEGQV